MRRLHVLGQQELSLLMGGADKLPEGLPVVVECEEAAIPEAYGTFADGSLMRTLQEFSFYMEDGVPAPIEALDDKYRYETYRKRVVPPTHPPTHPPTSESPPPTHPPTHPSA